VRRPLDAWLEAEGLRPVVVAEVEDSALLKALGEDGTGFFAVASVISDDVCRQYRVRPVGRIPTVRERYFVLSLERRVRHPGVAALLEAARQMATEGGR
jgi:LysR family transcriptional activator of nhaA